MRPPGGLATFGLLSVYFLSFLLLIFSVLVVAVGANYDKISVTEIVEYQKPDGRMVQKEQMYQFDVLIYEADLSEDGRLYHGWSCQYYTDGVIEREGSWYEGKWDGEWKFYDHNGDLVRTTVFDKGKFVSYKVLENGQWVDKQFAELPIEKQQSYIKHAQGPPIGPVEQDKSVSH